MKLDTILVPTDFSDDAQHALDIAIEWAKKYGSRVVLLHAYHVDLPFISPAYGGDVILPDTFFTEYGDQAKKQIEELAAETASKSGLDVSGVAVDSHAWMAILDEAERLPADLIVMGTRGLTGIKHIALGSTAERIVRKAKCPVLTVKAD